MKIKKKMNQNLQKTKKQRSHLEIKTQNSLKKLMTTINRKVFRKTKLSLRVRKMIKSQIMLNRKTKKKVIKDLKPKTVSWQVRVKQVCKV